MNTEIRVVVISAVTALITSGLVAVAHYTVRNREKRHQDDGTRGRTSQGRRQGASTACARVGGERYQLLLEGQRSLR